MTFDEWWMEYQGAIKWVDEGASHARAAWDYQQTIIDELEASWRDDDSLTIAYLRGFSDDKKESQEQDDDI